MKWVKIGLGAMAVLTFALSINPQVKKTLSDFLQKNQDVPTLQEDLSIEEPIFADFADFQTEEKTDQSRFEFDAEAAEKFLAKEASKQSDAVRIATEELSIATEQATNATEQATNATERATNATERANTAVLSLY